jgi:hypothetical protein
MVFNNITVYVVYDYLQQTAVCLFLCVSFLYLPALFTLSDMLRFVWRFIWNCDQTWRSLCSIFVSHMPLTQSKFLPWCCLLKVWRAVSHALDQVRVEFSCAVGKGHVLVGLTGTSTSHPGVSGIRHHKATLPPSGVDGLLFRLLEQRLVFPGEKH